MVKKQSPAQYKEALSKLGDENIMRKTLEANAVPSYLFEVDDSKVEQFLGDRRKLMAKKVKMYYDSL